MNCPRCGVAAAIVTAKFCEDCGAPLFAEPPADIAGDKAVPLSRTCAACGAGPDEIDNAGYCTTCGLERHRTNERDHWEVTVSPGLAGVCDLGLKRLRNEDFIALAEGDGVRVSVVCDGVSQCRDGDDAASAAAPLVCNLLLEAARANPTHGMEKAMRSTLLSAHQAVTALAGQSTLADDAPAATIVAAVVRKSDILLGWLGDCRAYWIGHRHRQRQRDAGPIQGIESNAPCDASFDDARLLTKDHSWINEVVDAGKLTYEEACRRKGAHAITRSLGGPSADAAGMAAGDEASLLRLSPTGPGWLLLCSDGLWGYAREPAEMALWLQEAAQNAGTGDAVAVARALVELARRRGGRDNVSAALTRL